MEKLAGHFKVRRERILAIVALHELRLRDHEEGRPFDAEFHKLGVSSYGETYSQGSGERHVKPVSTFPNFEVIDSASEGDPSAHKGIDREAEMKKVSEFEEKLLYNDFKDRLEYNLAHVGKDLERKASRHSRTIRRPEGGWTYIVKPLGPRGRSLPAYAGKPDGSRRELTESEKLLQKRKTPKPRKKLY